MVCTASGYSGASWRIHKLSLAAWAVRLWSVHRRAYYGVSIYGVGISRRVGEPYDIQRWSNAQEGLPLATCSCFSAMFHDVERLRVYTCRETCMVTGHYILTTVHGVLFCLAPGLYLL